jgi:hypothetical protein
MADVFISYKRDDLGSVQKLVAALRSAGLSVWWDHNIAPDAPWEATIEKELDAASAVIVAWSQAAVASDNVRAESRRARQRGKLIQVFVEPCEPPLFFGERQGVDLKGWSGDASDRRFQTILTGVRAIMTDQRPPEGVGYVTRAHSGWMFPVAVAVFAIVAVVVAAGLIVGREGDCTIGDIGCSSTDTIQDSGVHARPPAGTEMNTEPPAVAERADVSAQPQLAVPGDTGHFPNARGVGGFCDTIREVASMVDQEFAPWKRGDPVSLSGGLVWRSSYRLPAAVSCNVQQTNPEVLPSYACRWDTPSAEEAARESARLLQAIMQCSGAARGGEDKALIGNAVFWVHVVDIMPNQVRVIVMWS